MYLPRVSIDMRSDNSNFVPNSLLESLQWSLRWATRLELLPSALFLKCLPMALAQVPDMCFGMRISPTSHTYMAGASARRYALGQK